LPQCPQRLYYLKCLHHRGYLESCLCQRYPYSLQTLHYPDYLRYLQLPRCRHYPRSLGIWL
jgi:hypothetical protein